MMKKGALCVNRSDIVQTSFFAALLRIRLQLLNELRRYSLFVIISISSSALL